MTPLLPSGKSSPIPTANPESLSQQTLREETSKNTIYQNPEYWYRFSLRYPDLQIRSRGYIPHFEIPNGIYFITFHLADSLPQPVLDQYLSDRQKIFDAAERQGRDLTPSDRAELHLLFSVKIDQYLDSGAGECYLEKTEIAQTVAGALRYATKKSYRLFAWCIMPNHVHAVIQTIGDASLAKILHSWKSFTANGANKMLGRNGSFWQREYYDHLIRDGAEFDRRIAYVMQNPAKAGLRGWKWIWMAEGLKGGDAVDG